MANTWTVVDGDNLPVSTHPTREEAVAAAREEVAELRAQFPEAVAEGGRITRNVVGPDGEIEGVS